MKTLTASASDYLRSASAIQVSPRLRERTGRARPERLDPAGNSRPSSTGRSSRRCRVYLVEKTRFDIVASACASFVIRLFLGGLLDLYNSWIAALGLPFVLSGWLFFLLLYLAGELLSVPFTLYFVFRIENRYGFNTMTYRLWSVDFLKGPRSPSSCSGLYPAQASG